VGAVVTCAHGGQAIANRSKSLRDGVGMPIATVSGPLFRGGMRIRSTRGRWPVRYRDVVGSSGAVMSQGQPW